MNGLLALLVINSQWRRTDFGGHGQQQLTDSMSWYQVASVLTRKMEKRYIMSSLPGTR